MTGSREQAARYRVIVDTNILISALLYGGTPAVVFEDIIMSQTLVLSDHIVDELIAYLKIVRPKLSQKWVRALREQLIKYCYEYDINAADSRDPQDNPILALALTQNAFIVSGDRDLLEYEADARIAVLSSAAYAELFVDSVN